VYPVRYEADYIEPQNRWKGLFRWILAIPWLILGSIYGLVAEVVALLAWFAIVFTGRYPEGLYKFQAGFLRFSGRATAFTMLQTEQWPPFGFDEDPEYQVRVAVDPRLEHYNRWRTGFRLILGIPVLFMVGLFQYLYFAAATIAWLHIVFIGRTSGGIHNALTTGLTYQLRTFAYFLLVTETLPPVSDQEPAGSAAGPKPAARKALARGSTATAAKPKPAPARRSAGAKAPARKPAAKKSAAKKPAAKKPAAKKPARRKPTGGKS
jgi:Domain of unknown function (DUF4389)